MRINKNMRTDHNTVKNIRRTLEVLFNIYESRHVDDDCSHSGNVLVELKELNNEFKACLSSGEDKDSLVKIATRLNEYCDLLSFSCIR